MSKRLGAHRGKRTFADAQHRDKQGRGGGATDRNETFCVGGGCFGHPWIHPWWWGAHGLALDPPPAAGVMCLGQPWIHPWGRGAHVLVRPGSTPGGGGHMAQTALDPPLHAPCISHPHDTSANPLRQPLILTCSRIDQRVRISINKNEAFSSSAPVMFLLTPGASGTKRS